MTGDHRPIACFEGADDARHLGRQDAEQPLNVADDHGAAAVQQGEGEELDLFEAVGPTASGRSGQAEVGEQLEHVLGDVLKTDPIVGGDHDDLLSGSRVRLESGTHFHIQITNYDYMTTDRESSIEKLGR